MKKMHKAPRTMKGKIKQTEGYTPRDGMSAGKKAGAMRKREKRLEKEPM